MDGVNGSFKKEFIKNLIVTGGYNYVSQLINFFASTIIARFLLPENFGVVAIIAVFTGFVTIFSDSGISLAVIKSRYGYSYDKAMDTLSIFIGVLLFMILTIIAFPITAFYEDERLLLPTILLGSNFVLRSVVIVRGALLSKTMDFNYLGKVTILTTLISGVLTILLAYFGAEHWSLIISQLASSILTAILYESRVRLGFKLYSLKYVIVGFNRTKSVILNLIGFNLINYWARNSDNLIIGKLYGVRDLGIYSRAYTLLTLPLSLISGLTGSILYPSLKGLKDRGVPIQEEYLFILNLINMLSFPVAFILIVFPEELVGVLWGGNWSAVSSLLPYFGVLIFSQSLLSTCGNVLILEGKEKALLFSGWVGAAIMIIGIAIGSSISILAIGQVYSLFFILFVVPFNMFYLFVGALRFRCKDIFFFWVPIIIASIGVWVGCYRQSDEIKLSFLMGLLIVIVLRNGSYLKKAVLSLFIQKGAKIAG